MPPRNETRNDTKLLLAVAGVVVAGAVAVALVAGLAVEDEREQATVSRTETVRSAVTRPEPRRDRVEPEIQLASLETEPVEADLAPTLEPEAPAVEIDPDADPWSEGSRAYHRRDFTVAAAYFAVDADARPERAYTHYMLGLSLWKSGRPDEALAAMTRAAELNDGSIRTFINLSRIQNVRGEYQAALEAAERALAIDDENTTALYQRARSEYNLGRVDEASETLEACIALDQAAAEAHNLLGLIRLQRGDDAQALTAFETAAALQPDVAHVQNNLGLALERSGRLEEAAVALRRAIELDGNHQAAAVSLERIAARLPVDPGPELPELDVARAQQD